MPAPDPASPLVAAIRAALRVNEIGDGNPYALSYAGLAKSGPSFGIFQGDVAVNPLARSTLCSILKAAGTPDDKVVSLMQQLRVPCHACPLGPADAALVRVALDAPTGRALVDTMDEATLDTVLSELGTAIDAAKAVGKTLDGGAAIAIALWSNMTGLPSVLDRWIHGAAVAEAGGSCAPPPGPIVTLADVERYLRLTAFFTAHPRNFGHLMASVSAGLAVEAA